MNDLSIPQTDPRAGYLAHCEQFDVAWRRLQDDLLAGGSVVNDDGRRSLGTHEELPATTVAVLAADVLVGGVKGKEAALEQVKGTSAPTWIRRGRRKRRFRQGCRRRWRAGHAACHDGARFR